MLWSKFEINEIFFQGFLTKLEVGSVWILVWDAEMFCLSEKSVMLLTAARSYH